MATVYSESPVNLLSDSVTGGIGTRCLCSYLITYLIHYLIQIVDYYLIII